MYKCTYNLFYVINTYLPIVSSYLDLTLDTGYTTF